MLFQLNRPSQTLTCLGSVATEEGTLPEADVRYCWVVPNSSRPTRAGSSNAGLAAVGLGGAVQWLGAVA